MQVSEIPFSTTQNMSYPSESVTQAGKATLSSSRFDAGSPLSESSKTSIRNTIVRFLDRCETPCTAVSMPDEFKNSCIKDAVSLGYPIAECDTLPQFFEGGALMSYTAYAHREPAVRMYIARYTAVVLFLDDNYKIHYDGLLRFNERFLYNERQEEGINQCLTKLLIELPQHFSPVACNLITTSTLNFVTSLILEHDTKDIELSSQAFGYPRYMRSLSAIPESYAFFIFARNSPLESYIQALPEIYDYIGYTNDVLSFYKEEVQEETANYVSSLASCRSISKDAAFQHLCNECATDYERAVQILQPYREACEAWLAYCTGYVIWHASLSRYKLEELGLTTELIPQKDQRFIV